MALAWHVVRTKPQQEMLAAKGLREQGFVVRMVKRYRRETYLKRAEAVAALRFEGYLFVQFDARLDMHGVINNTRGVASSIGNPGLICDAAGNPQTMPDSAIERMVVLEDDEFIAAKKPASKDAGRKDLNAGDKVRIDDGNKKWGGREGVFLVNERGISKVLMGSMCAEIADVDLTVIEVVRSAPAAKFKTKAKGKRW